MAHFQDKMVNGILEELLFSEDANAMVEQLHFEIDILEKN